MSKYKFELNLIKASKSKNIDDAKKEWVDFYDNKKDKNINDEKKEKLENCICGHVVKNIKYMYNKETTITIIIGSTCANKFNMEQNIKIKYNKSHNNIFINILIKIMNEKNKYDEIIDIIEYSKNNEKQIRNEFEKNIIKNNEHINELKKIEIELDEIIKKYNVNYLIDIHKNLNSKIKNFYIEQYKQKIIKNNDNIIELKKIKIELDEIIKKYNEKYLIDIHENLNNKIKIFYIEQYKQILTNNIINISNFQKLLFDINNLIENEYGLQKKYIKNLEQKKIEINNLIENEYGLQYKQNKIGILSEYDKTYIKICNDEITDTYTINSMIMNDFTNDVQKEKLKIKLKEKDDENKFALNKFLSIHNNIHKNIHKKYS
jgi:hypothetical protein